MIRRLGSIVGAVLGSAVFLFVLLRLASPAAAEGLIVVNPGESIQAAIDGATDGDTILITAGTYTESLTLNKPVSLTGVSSATTILHAEPNDRVLTVTGATITKGVVISGLMLTGGDVSGLAPGLNYGGGMALLNSAEPSIHNVLFYDNKVQEWGGALYSDGNLMLSGSKLISNTADDAGGASLSLGMSTISNSLITNNHCTTTICYGGGVYASVAAKITGTTITSNTTDGFGGGMWVGGDLIINNAVISGNTATEFGGGIFEQNGSTTIIDSLIIGNQGNGVRADTMVAITGTTFSSNTTTGDGGGLNAEGIIRIYDSVFSGNSGNEGAGAYVGGQVWVTASTFEAKSRWWPYCERWYAAGN